MHATHPLNTAWRPFFRGLRAHIPRSSSSGIGRGECETFAMSPALQRLLMAEIIQLPGICRSNVRRTSHKVSSGDPGEPRGRPKFTAQLPNSCLRGMVQTRPTLSDTWPSFGELRPTLASFPKHTRFWFEVAQMLAFAQFWSELANIWPMFAKIWPMLRQLCSNFAKATASARARERGSGGARGQRERGGEGGTQRWMDGWMDGRGTGPHTSTACMASAPCAVGPLSSCGWRASP